MNALEDTKESFDVVVTRLVSTHSSKFATMHYTASQVGISRNNVFFFVCKK